MAKYYQPIVVFVDAVNWNGENIMEVQNLIGKKYSIIDKSIIFEIDGDIFKIDVGEWVVFSESSGLWCVIDDDIFRMKYRILNI